MAARKPKDLQLAEIAYNTFYDEPQVPFDDLATSYQMRWVRVVRAAGRSRASSNGGSTTPREGGTKPSRKAKPSKRADWAEEDKKDRALFTDKKWKEKSKEEIAARHRVHYRQKVNGLVQEQGATP